VRPPAHGLVQARPGMIAAVRLPASTRSSESLADEPLLAALNKLLRGGGVDELPEAANQGRTGTLQRSTSAPRVMSEALATHAEDPARSSRRRVSTVPLRVDHSVAGLEHEDHRVAGASRRGRRESENTRHVTSPSSLRRAEPPRDASPRPSPTGGHGRTAPHRLSPRNSHTSPRNGHTSPRNGHVSPRSASPQRLSPRSGHSSPRSSSPGRKPDQWALDSTIRIANMSAPWDKRGIAAATTPGPGHYDVGENNSYRREHREPRTRDGMDTHTESTPRPFGAAGTTPRSSLDSNRSHCSLVRRFE